MTMLSIRSLASLSAPVRVRGNPCLKALFWRTRNADSPSQHRKFSSRECEGHHFHHPFVLPPDLFPSVLASRTTIQSA
jgi:hypothetical protein